MAHNDPRNPELARASQDVDQTPAALVLPLKKVGTAGSGSGKAAAQATSFHVGRGGEGNVASKAREEQKVHESLMGGLLGKGKEAVGVGRK
jgi:hypothetical protein